MPTASSTIRELRAAGVVRYVAATFLGLWLCGWAAGELAALIALVWVVPKMASGAIGYLGVIAFILAWLTFWTIGGAAALWQFCACLAGRDQFERIPGGVRVTRRAPPFVRRRLLPDGAVQTIRLSGRQNELVASVDGKEIVLTTLGSTADRLELRDWLRRELAIAPAASGEPPRLPSGWVAQFGHDGFEVMTENPRYRRLRALIVGVLFIAVATSIMLVLQRGRHPATWSASTWIGASVLGGLALLLGWAALWSWLGRTEWVLHQGTLERRRWLAGHRWGQPVHATRLAVTCREDSDGDKSISLVGIAGTQRITLQRDLNEVEVVLAMGRWLAARTQVPLDTDASLRSPP